MTEFGRINPDGSVEHIRSIPQSAFSNCPFYIISPDHYRDDLSCRCDDPDHLDMDDWGYRWDAVQGRWVAGDENDPEAITAYLYDADGEREQETLWAANGKVSFNEDVSDPVFEIAWVSTDGWRGYNDVTAIDGAGWKHEAEGCYCGEWDDAPSGTSGPELDERFKALAAERGKVLVVFAPTSNAFSTGWDAFVPVAA